MNDLIRCRHLNGALLPRLDHISAREYAIDLLKKAGFQLHEVARNSTTAYYTHHGRPPYLLRVSDHKSKGSPMGIPNAIARLTISPKDAYLTTHHVENLVVAAIGRYFLSDPIPSEYDGPNMKRLNGQETLEK